ncbi:FliH/SctL family protein [Limnobacter humi]|uniref:Flagellar assembly protein FliH n=1 Tax=Limnobacter humi TaxID=1778671 RepID=A0ABT1WL20_9BURK|nr:FliH/SctL family protein [Limnobacter humi]MCQ8897757.1 FliH/SctL family protein [Limnobacter humi]
MPSSNRIIRGAEASTFTGWNIDLLGNHYEGPVDRLLTEISQDRPAPELLPKRRELSEEEIRLQNWEMVLREREAQLTGLEEEAQQRGYKQGQQQGYAEGFEQAEQERQTLTAVAAQINDQFEQYKTQLADKLLALAVSVSKKVLADTLQAHTDHAALLLNQVLDGLQLDGKAMTVRAHPSTLAQLKQHLGEDHTLGNVRWVEDPQQLPGGLVLQHAEGEVDASIQTRWMKAIEALGLDTALTPADLD